MSRAGIDARAWCSEGVNRWWSAEIGVYVADAVVGVQCVWCEQPLRGRGYRRGDFLKSGFLGRVLALSGSGKVLGSQVPRFLD